MQGNFYNKFRRITSSRTYLPEIDGLRFLLIMSIVIFHIAGYLIHKSGIMPQAGTATYFIYSFFTRLNRAVILFFMLSGFIVCLPFAQQYLLNGKEISLKRYYLRRLTRMEVPYAVAITGIFLLEAVAKMRPLHVLLPGWLASLGYVHIIIYHRPSIITGVAYTLEIEIQFYLLAPLLFRLLALPALFRRLVICSAAIVMILLQNRYHSPFLSIYNFFQYFLAGIFLADLYVTRATSYFYQSRWILLVCIISAAVVLLIPLRAHLLSRFIFLIANAVFFYFALTNILCRKMLSFRPFTLIGGMSYSIYLLHYTIIIVCGRYVVGWFATGYNLFNVLLQIVLLIIPVVLCSTVFYYYVERPFMSRKWMDMLLKKNKKVAEINPVAEIEKGS